MNNHKEQYNNADPDQIISVILNDIADYIEGQYGETTLNSRFFNVQKVSYLLGSQFILAKEARIKGLIIEDCEMCSYFDRQIGYCNYYNQIFRMEKELYYYYKALCPALVVK